ncbi:hypothetical protein [Rhodococcoides fascians]|uniref:hypothetical protein n=1 Tax=Rhodococcoides fascians TaxID=1828 RepID=UPI001F5B7963|nr:hypothetical protein [Rhodococcus fascians]
MKAAEFVVEIHPMANYSNQFGSEYERVPNVKVVLERRPQALGTGVVPANPDLAHRTPQPVLFARFLCQRSGMLPSAVRVCDCARDVAATVGDCHVQSIQN